MRAARPILALILVAVLGLGSTACLHTGTVPASTISKIVTFENTFNTAATQAFNVVTAAATAGLISQADANAIVAGITQAEQANQQAQTLTATIQTLSASNQATLLNLLQPIATAINNLVANGTVNIKDAKTKTDVLGVLVTLQTLLAGILVVIQVATS